MNVLNTRYRIAACIALSTLAVGSVSLTATARSIALPVEAASEAIQPGQMVAQASAVRATSAQDQTLYLNNDRTYSYNLEVSGDTNFNGSYIPAGATIIGQYEPAPGGLRYVARAVSIDGRSYAFNAVSEVIEDVKDPRDTSVGGIAGDAGIGAAGGAIIGEILGDIDAGEVIGGAAAGVIIGNVTADRVVVIRPDDPIILYSR